MTDVSSHKEGIFLVSCRQRDRIKDHILRIRQIFFHWFRLQEYSTFSDFPDDCPNIFFRKRELLPVEYMAVFRKNSAAYNRNNVARKRLLQNCSGNGMPPEQCRNQPMIVYSFIPVPVHSVLPLFRR